MFNYSELYFSEVISYKIHTLDILLLQYTSKYSTRGAILTSDSLYHTVAVTDRKTIDNRILYQFYIQTQFMSLYIFMYIFHLIHKRTCKYSYTIVTMT